MPINNSMKEQEISKDKKEATEDSVNVVEITVFDHLLIVDNTTGEKIVNKRG